MVRELLNQAGSFQTVSTTVAIQQGMPFKIEVRVRRRDINFKPRAKDVTLADAPDP